MKCQLFINLKRLFKETFNPLACLDSLDRTVHNFDDFVVFLTASRFDPITIKK